MKSIIIFYEENNESKNIEPVIAYHSLNEPDKVKEDEIKRFEESTKSLGFNPINVVIKENTPENRKELNILKNDIN